MALEEQKLDIGKIPIEIFHKKSLKTLFE